MQAIAAICLVLSLAACASWDAERRARLAAADDAKCQGYGFKPGTEPYGNCRLQVEQIRATQQVAADIRNHE
jgi:hypothetical protein